MSGEIVYEPHDHDVKGGKGHGSNMHPGNRFYQAQVKNMKPLYSKTESNFEKSLIATEIVNSVQQRNPPGRFLEQIGKNKPWTVLSQDKVIKKVKQALRDKQQPSKEKVKGDKQEAKPNITIPEPKKTTAQKATPASVPVPAPTPTVDLTIPPMPPLSSTENDMEKNTHTSTQYSSLISSIKSEPNHHFGGLSDSLRTSQLIGLPDEQKQEYRHVSVDQIGNHMNGNIMSNNDINVHQLYASEGHNLQYKKDVETLYKPDGAFSAYIGNNVNTLNSDQENSQFRHSLPVDPSVYPTKNQELLRQSLPTQRATDKEQNTQPNPRPTDEMMHMSLSPFASAELNGIVSLLQEELDNGTSTNDTADRHEKHFPHNHPSNQSNIQSQGTSIAVIDYKDQGLDVGINNSDLNQIMDCLGDEPTTQQSSRKRRNVNAQDHSQYPQSQQHSFNSSRELPLHNNHRRPTLLNYQVQRNSNSQLMKSNNFMEGMASRDAATRTDLNQFPRRTPQSSMNAPADDDDEKSITLDDLKEEECKHNTNQGDSNYVGSSASTQKYPQALDLRQSHNSHHSRPLHNSTIQIKQNDCNIDMACSESSLSVGDLLGGQNASTVDVQSQNRQDTEHQQSHQQSNGIENEGTLSDGAKDATMDFDNTKNADFWGSVMSQMEYSFQNVMNFVSGKDGKAERENS